jgi:tetratricopeptide (TPR) repeat protein
MRLTRILVILLFSQLLHPVPAFAHDPMRQEMSVNGDLGTTHFANSGAARAQPAFLRGLLLLHSFEYSAARHSFQEAEKADPGFAMAYWGEALTYNQSLWRQQDRDAALAALAKLASDPAARAAKAPTARERAYLGSVEQLYGAGDKTSRDANFSAALGALAASYPDDLDARAFYALSLMGLSNGDRNVANYMRAAAEAEAVLQVAPRHPGALHYLIHATDDPLHAPLGLAAARLYGGVAPAASHAHHMPSHIFFALGMWNDAIDANVASLKLGRAQGDPSYHALLWLAYAYLQLDRRADAEELVRSVARDVAAGATKDNRARLAFARAMWLVETRGTEGPDARTPVDNSGITSINYFAAHDFARGITAAAERPAEATAALVQLQGRIDAAHVAQSQAATVNWLDNVTGDELKEAQLLAMALAGTIKFYAGDAAGGIEQVRAASAGAEHLDFEYGPPWSVKPLDELLGELLLAAGRPSEAVAAYRKTLAVFPNRRLASEGLTGALARLGSGPAPSAVPPLTREDLIGSWRLVRIEYRGPKGALDDPFYHAQSTGLLTYDASGAMSVQIAAGTRPTLSIPATRPLTAAAIPDERAKAAALDSYYAYFGTWELDAEHSSITHHIISALIPAETGMSYSQDAKIEGGTLTFTNRKKAADGEYVRTKYWQRCDTSQRCQ